MLCTCLAFAVWKSGKVLHGKTKKNDFLLWVVQTNPQKKQALPTQLLAEMLGLSVDHPVRSSTFSTKNAEKRMRAFPFIEGARISLQTPNALYVDYTLRRPIAYVEDFENIAVDVQGFLFPIDPFYKSMALPRIYCGFSPFGEHPVKKTAPPVATWQRSISGKHFTLALSVLSLIEAPAVKDAFPHPCIDVSHAEEESAATREIVLRLEDVEMRVIGKREIRVHHPRILRLSTIHFAQELGNYLKLREQLILAEAEKHLEVAEHRDFLRMSPTVIDLRIPDLAFVKME